jgi:LysR family glycine cleavage system transcriptional activator
MSPSTARGLAVFCIVARHLSFKSAARDLYVTPSAVSHQIKALERQFGVTLFERRTRSIALTPVGASLFSQVDPLFRDIERAASVFSPRRRERRILHLTLLPFFASELFIPNLGSWTGHDTSIDIRVDNTDDRESEDLRGADAAILLLSVPPRNPCAHALFSLRLAPACAPAVAEGLVTAGPEALREKTLIVHKSRPNAWNRWFAQNGIRQENLSRLIYLDSMYAVARAAERGLGVALVPMPLSEAWFQSRALVKLFEAELETRDRYYFLNRPDDSDDRDILALRDWVLTTFGPNAKYTSGRRA